MKSLLNVYVVLLLATELGNYSRQRLAEAMTMAEREGIESYQEYPGVVYISGTALNSARRTGYCSGVFVAPSIVLTAGRCLTGVDGFG